MSGESMYIAGTPGYSFRQNVQNLNTEDRANGYDKEPNAGQSEYCRNREDRLVPRARRHRLLSGHFSINSSRFMEAGCARLQSLLGEARSGNGTRSAPSRDA